VRNYLQRVGQLRVHRDRKVHGWVKTINVERESILWYVVLSCADVPARPLPPTGCAVGVDQGAAAFWTTSDEIALPNPRHPAGRAGGLRAAHRALSTFPRLSSADRRCADPPGASKQPRQPNRVPLSVVRHTAHADMNAVHNILRTGLALSGRHGGRKR
jgi:transposase